MTFLRFYSFDLKGARTASTRFCLGVALSEQRSSTSRGRWTDLLEVRLAGVSYAGRAISVREVGSARVIRALPVSFPKPTCSGFDLLLSIAREDLWR